MGLGTAVFLASTVEMVEALTIVMAMGMTRSWRSTFAGVAVALVALATFTMAAGYALVLTPPDKASTPLLGAGLVVAFVVALRIDTRTK